MNLPYSESKQLFLCALDAFYTAMLTSRKCAYAGNPPQDALIEKGLGE